MRELRVLGLFGVVMFTREVQMVERMVIVWITDGETEPGLMRVTLRDGP